MAKIRVGVDLEAVVEKAKQKGFFALEDYPGLRLSQQEFVELGRLLQRRSVPLERPEGANPPSTKPTVAEARRMIDALRKGVPARDGLQHYSIGREQLLATMHQDLDVVAANRSLVRFLNADIGQGKTHSLYLLREFAFARGFAVSIVTLSQDACPLYDFMAVYREVMWGLRTPDQREKPALLNVIDRVIAGMRGLSNTKILEFVGDEETSDFRQIMAAYIDAGNMFRHSAERQQRILKYLSGERMTKSEVRELGISFWLNSTSALDMLGQVAKTLRYIGFRGICILFDEAEAIHSFARYKQRRDSYVNLAILIKLSELFPHCYFIYATTPSFFEEYTKALAAEAGPGSILQLPPLSTEERQEVASRIALIYSLATAWQPSAEVMTAIRMAATYWTSERMGDCVRKVIAILDEAKVQA